MNIKLYWFMVNSLIDIEKEVLVLNVLYFLDIRKLIVLYFYFVVVLVL